MTVYYPVSLDLDGRGVTVIGGDNEAAAKVRGLLAVNARVRVVTSVPGPGLSELAEMGRITLWNRSYRAGDLSGAFAAIVFPGEVHDLPQLVREARDRRVLLNVVDDPARCDFIAPAVLREGDLSIAISTNGVSPALAVRLREELRACLGNVHGRLLALIGELRPFIKTMVDDFDARRCLAYRMIDSDALMLLRQGREEDARTVLQDILGSLPEEPGDGG